MNERFPDMLASGKYRSTLSRPLRSTIEQGTSVPLQAHSGHPVWSLIVLLAATASGCASFGERAPDPNEPLVDLHSVDPRIVIDIRYAATNNFMKRVLYPAPRCLLRESVARRLSRVQDDLAREGLGLKVFDGYRPLSVQRVMWEVMPDERYVANPAKGSRHNRGAAVDVTLVEASGRELEMPSGYDDFTERAHRDYAGGSPQARANRDRLIRAMHRHGFRVLETEWWHFDAPGWQNYPVLDIPLTEIPATSPQTAPVSAGDAANSNHPPG